MLQVSGFYDNSCTNGEGWRSVIFFSGCPHHCPGCHNPETWDYSAGEEFSPEELAEKVLSNKDLIDGVTLSGGEPLQERNISDLLILINILKENGLTIWCYTGYRLEELQVTDKFSSLLEQIDVLIDGPFIKDLYDPGLKFRGSSNQNINYFNKILN